LSFLSCGKKGPLILEPPKLPLAVEKFALRQAGNRIVVEWEFPSKLSDQKTAVETVRIGKISVFSSEKPILPAEKFRKKAALLKKIAFAETKKTGEKTYETDLQFKIKALKGKQYYIAMLYEYGKKRAALSPVLPIKTMVPPRPVSDLKIIQENKVLVLQWSKPADDADGDPLPSILGYKIYRKINAGKGEPEFKVLNGKPLYREVFEDEDSSQDGEYAYTVTTLLAETTESDFSNPVKISVRDLYPPDIPTNLITFTGTDHVFLSWEPVRDADLSHYRLYRKTVTDPDFQLLADRIETPSFKDTQAKKGGIYAYAVTAVDRKGNESEPSKPAQHKFE
jgi:hypothetical protein